MLVVKIAFESKVSIILNILYYIFINITDFLTVVGLSKDATTTVRLIDAYQKRPKQSGVREFESYTCHNKNTTGEEGKGKRFNNVYFPRKNSTALSLVPATLEIEYAT